MNAIISQSSFRLLPTVSTRIRPALLPIIPSPPPHPLLSYCAPQLIFHLACRLFSILTARFLISQISVVGFDLLPVRGQGLLSGSMHPQKADDDDSDSLSVVRGRQTCRLTLNCELSRT